MLIAGTNSTCDVCLEPFGRDGKTPCSITCGHVFCIDCLQHINPSTCPLCRQFFEPRYTVKIHVDLDNVKALPSPKGNEIDHEGAEKLSKAISAIAEEGCSETHVRLLISKGKEFLQKQPKGQFKDLRTLYRMVSYLTEVKTNLRSQKMENERLKKEHAQLLAERKELITRLEKESRAIVRERGEFYKNEEILREHCAKAHQAYETMVQQYNYVAKEWTRTSEEIRKLREASLEGGLQGSPYAHYSPYELNQDRLAGYCLFNDQNSILISPLPQFTTKFNTTSLLNKELPDVDEEDEEEDEDEEYEEEDLAEDEEDEEEDWDKARTQTRPMPPPTEAVLVPALCSSPRHPHACGCVAEEVIKSHTLVASSSSERLAALQRSKPAPQEDRGFALPNPSGISRTAPYAEARRSRSHSIPSQGTSRTPSSSRPSSRSVSPARPPISTRVSNSGQSSLSHEVTSPLAASSVRSSDQDGLRSRLHNILADASSSSPPKSTAVSASASVRENRPARDERRRSASRSPSPPASGLRRHSSQMRHSQQQQPPQQQHAGGANTTDQFSRLLASHQPANPGVPSISTSPNPRTSSASDAAQLLEQSKRERQKADRERRHAAVDRDYRDRDGDLARSGGGAVQATSNAMREPVAGSHSVQTSSASHHGYSRGYSTSSNNVSPSKSMPTPNPTNGYRESYQQQQQPYQPRQQSTMTYAPNSLGIYA